MFEIRSFQIFLFKPPFTFKTFHVPPPVTILGNQVTSCNKLKSYEIEESLKMIYFLRNTLSIVVEIYKTIILPVVLYGCETWSLTLRGTKQSQGVSGPSAEKNI
jgi:CRISPR/Cas system-associated protein Cas5 (RAMP superfamily)